MQKMCMFVKILLMCLFICIHTYIQQAVEGNWGQLVHFQWRKFHVFCNKNLKVNTAHNFFHQILYFKINLGLLLVQKYNMQSKICFISKEMGNKRTLPTQSPTIWHLVMCVCSCKCTYLFIYDKRSRKTLKRRK